MRQTAMSFACRIVFLAFVIMDKRNVTDAASGTLLGVITWESGLMVLDVQLLDEESVT
jgi:hypothetical protein